MPCPSRQHGASVIRAAGDDTRRYDALPTAVRPESHAVTQPRTERGITDTATDMLPAYSGYVLSGRPDLAVPVEGYLYERGA